MSISKKDYLALGRILFCKYAAARRDEQTMKALDDVTLGVAAYAASNDDTFDLNRFIESTVPQFRRAHLHELVGATGEDEVLDLYLAMSEDEDDGPCCYGYVTSRGQDHEYGCTGFVQ